MCLLLVEDYALRIHFSLQRIIGCTVNYFFFLKVADKLHEDSLSWDYCGWG